MKKMVGRSGERGIEFDILQGQDIPMNTDMMEFLRNNMLNGTGRFDARMYSNIHYKSLLIAGKSLTR